MSKMKVAQDGPEAAAPKKSAAPKSDATKRVELLTHKIQVAKDLENLIRGREIFQDKLDQLTECETDFAKSEGKDWENDRMHKVTFLSGEGEYSQKPVFHFSQRALIADFMEFIRERIEKKIEDFDGQILNLEL